MTQVNQSSFNPITSGMFNLDERENIEQVLAELHGFDPVPPIGKTLLAINPDETAISDEFRFFFETIIGDFEASLNESYEWMGSRNAAA